MSYIFDLLIFSLEYNIIASMLRCWCQFRSWIFN